MAEEPKKTQRAPRRPPGRRVLLQVFLIVALFLAAVLLGRFVEQSAVVRTVVSGFGFLGIFIVSVASGFNLALPVPVVAFLPLFLGAGFSFWPTLVVITLGMTVGDGLGFLVGSAGRRAVDMGGGGGLTQWFEHIRRRYGLGAYMVLFLYAAFVPAPNELLVIPMSFANYQFRFMIPVVLVGNFLFNTLVALGVMRVVQFV
jgi:membrane protein YqaA with SNARE-associated domain